MKLRNWAFLPGALAILGGAFSVWAEIFDPPAIAVFPVHEEIGRAYPVPQAVADGRALFAAKFNELDGSGRPLATGDSKPTPRLAAGPSFHRISGPDANSCFGCHNQPELGGSGDLAANVFFGAQFADPIVEAIKGDRVNERNTPTLFGSGALELAAREMSRTLREQREAVLARARDSGSRVVADLAAKGVSFGSIAASPDGYVDYSGLRGVDYDLVVRPFGTKGVAGSLREFSIAALNHHHGIQAIERFGWERTGIPDFDQDGVAEEFTVGQTTAMVLFQASLAAPRSKFHDHPGFATFRQIGCASCHLPKISLETNVFSEPSEFNRPGTLIPRYTDHTVELELDLQRDGSGFYIEPFTDLRRHEMCDADRRRLCNEEFRQDNVPVSQFMTARLWDLATSGPYCHRGDCPTITEAILAHGGEAREPATAFDRLSALQKRELIAFLLLLGSELDREADRRPENRERLAGGH